MRTARPPSRAFFGEAHRANLRTTEVAPGIVEKIDAASRSRLGHAGQPSTQEMPLRPRPCGPAAATDQIANRVQPGDRLAFVVEDAIVGIDAHEAALDLGVQRFQAQSVAVAAHADRREQLFAAHRQAVPGFAGEADFWPSLWPRTSVTLAPCGWRCPARSGLFQRRRDLFVFDGRMVGRASIGVTRVPMAL